MTRRSLVINQDTWPLKEPFVIARGSRTETTVIKVTISKENHQGIGECVPTPRYGESLESVTAQIETIRENIEAGLGRKELQKLLSAGAARNAVDCALWDLDAKIQQQPVSKIIGTHWPEHINTVQTISIGTPQKMRESAHKNSAFKTLKVKLNAEDIIARMSAVRAGAPNATLIIDANESWDLETLKAVTPLLAELNVAMIEQPLPAGKDTGLINHQSSIPLCADESCHTSADLDHLIGKYDMINIKLDKTGGLTEALALADNAIEKGFNIMVGCMVSTSLGIAPAMFVALKAKYVDLDAPALLANDRDNALNINKGLIEILPKKLWGGA